MIKQKSAYKIALVGDSLSEGGAEKVHAILSLFFAGKGIEVHNIVFNDLISYEFSGALLNLGKLENKSVFDKLKRIHVLRKYIRKNQFDYIIDFRFRVNKINEFLISRYAYNLPTIYTVHSGILEFYLPKSLFLSQLIYNPSKQIVTVSKGIESLVKNKVTNPVTTIYNPIEMQKNALSSEAFIPEETNYIVAMGRLNSPVKQFDKLIEAYSNSVLPKMNISLLILGEGKLQAGVEQLAVEKKISDKVIFKGFQSNPFPYLKNALFTVVSSKNEGFPNVILESLAAGTPVVSFDCFSGPNEIISHWQNGLLVDNQNLIKLTEAMNLFVEDSELYEHCKQNARQSVSQFSIENIGKQWLDLMKINVS